MNIAGRTEVFDDATALAAGAALLLTGQVVATSLNFSPAWKTMMVGLVNAWGYGG